MEKKAKRAGKEEKAEANAMLAGGAAIAAIGVAGAVASGAVCPVCVVAAPLLLGIGAVRRIRAARQRSTTEGVAPLKDHADVAILRGTRSP